MGMVDLKALKAYERGWRKRDNRLKQLVKQDSTRTTTSDRPSSSADGSNTATEKKLPMDLELYKAAIQGNVDNFIETMVRVSTEKGLSLSSIFNDQSTPLGNSYLHVAASSGHHDLIRLIASHFPSLLLSRNSKGDTPMHVAARSEKATMSAVLLRFGQVSPNCCSSPAPSFVPTVVDLSEDEEEDYDDDSDDCDTDDDLLRSTNRKGNGAAGQDQYRSTPDILLRSTNHEGNTALHEAIVNRHRHAHLTVDRLMTVDLEVSFYVNGHGKSPLYLAVESGQVSVVKRMLEFFISKGYSCEEYLKGKSLVHAAIRARNKGTLDILLNNLPTLIQSRGEDGETPLHCATSIGYFEGVQYLLGKCSEFVLERDGNGFLPVHIASRKGYVDIVRTLLQHCPDWRELLTTQGKNILHVAAKNGKNNVVDYILTTLEHEKLLNEIDDRGNTPLHLASMHWHPKVVSSLTWDKRINLELLNDDGMTALDVAEERMAEITPSFQKRLTWMALKSAGAPHGKCSKVSNLNTQNSMEQHEQKNMENYKDRINTLLLVSTLVATVTYAAGFTMPGGYNNSAPDPGIATMLTKTNFQIFVICDTIAMYSSIIVAVTLIWAQLGDLNLILTSLRLALPLLGIALSMMSLAFMAGVYLVVSKLNWLAYVVLIMGIVSLAILLLLFIPLFFPNTSNCGVLRHISYYFFCLMMFASGSYHDDEEE